MIEADPALGLRVVAEQGGVQVGQLARFVGLGYDEAAKLADDWCARDWVEMHQFLVGEDPWLEPTWTGAKLSGTGLARRELRTAHVAHRRAVNEARLYLEAQAPKGRWVPERLVRREYQLGMGTPVPDGVFEVDGERHAIEVELTSKQRAKLVGKLVGYGDRYDRIVYFCSPSVLGVIESLAEEEGNSRLVVGKLPWVRRQGEASAPRPSARRRTPGSEEAALLELATDLGAMRIDHLAALSGLPRRHVEALVDSVEAGGFGSRVSVFPGDPDWLWPNGRAVRAVGGVGQGLRSLAAARMAEIAATNEVRCAIARELPAGVWRSARRAVAEGACARRGAPTALVVDGDFRLAVVVLVIPPRELEGFVARVRAWRAEYEDLWVFAEGGSESTRKLRARVEAEGASLRPIPDGGGR